MNTERTLKARHAALTKRLYQQVSKAAAMPKITALRKQILEMERTLKWVAKQISGLNNAREDIKNYFPERDDTQNLNVNVNGNSNSERKEENVHH